MNKLEIIREKILELSSKSEELLLGDFKQYFDEEWIDEVLELLDE